MARVVHEVEPFAVHDQQRRVFVAIEKARVGVRQSSQIIGGNRAFEIHAAAMDTLDQRCHRRLQIDNEVRRWRLRFQMRVDLLVQRVFIIGKVQARKQRILVEQKIGDGRTTEKIELREIP